MYAWTNFFLQVTFYFKNFVGRYELLSMVRKHSKFLEKTTIVEQDASDAEIDSQFWHEVLDLYFMRSRESKGRQDDDLIFFVRDIVWLFSFQKKDIVWFFFWMNFLVYLAYMIVHFLIKLSLQLTCWSMLLQNLHGYGFNDDMEEIPPYFVRRWAPKVKWDRSKIPSISGPCKFFSSI